MDLYYRAHDVHELLAHEAAMLSGFYQEAGIEVNLKDGAGAKWQDMEPVAPATIGIGGAIISRLTRGTNWAAVCVNTQHPLFWLVSQSSIERIDQLRGKRVAGRPLSQAPAVFTRIILRKHGLDLLKDYTYVSEGDEKALVEMLTRGEVDATFVNIPPFELERAGYRILAFYGSEFQTTTTGLAINQDVLSVNDPKVQRLVNASRQALAKLHTDRELAIRTIQQIETDTSSEDAALLYDRYIQPYWTSNGQPDKQIAETSLREIARELGVERVPTFSELYKAP